MKILDELLTLADRKEYYEHVKPWPKENDKEAPPRSPKLLTKDANTAHDNIKRLLGENDKLYANQLELRRDLRRVVVIAAIAVIASWSPLWLPLLKRLAGL